MILATPDGAWTVEEMRLSHVPASKADSVHRYDPTDGDGAYVMVRYGSTVMGMISAHGRATATSVAEQIEQLTGCPLRDMVPAGQVAVARLDDGGEWVRARRARRAGRAA